MIIRQITATFEKRLSDGRFGSELASMQLSAELAEHDDIEEVSLALEAQARELVLAQLGVSGSRYVRQALQQGEPSVMLPPNQVSLERSLAAIGAAGAGSSSAPETEPSSGDELEELPF